MEIEFDATQAMESRRDRAEGTRRALQDEIDAADAACAAKVIADLEAKLGMPWQQATTEQLRGAGCVNVRDVIAGLPEDEQSEIERQVAEREPNEETAQVLREAGEGKNLMGPYATADEMFDAFGLD